MNFESIGIVLVIVAVPTFVLAVGYYAVKGLQRQQMLVRLGEVKEMELLLKDEQDRILGRQR